MISPLVISSSALAAVAAHGYPYPFWGAPWLFFLIPLFWILVIGLVIGLVGRNRRRYWAQAGYGPGAWGPGGHGPWSGGPGAGPAGAESVLSDRFARGDIDEKEYRARLEVLRASVPPQPGGTR